MSVYTYIQGSTTSRGGTEGVCVCVCVCSKLGTINECIYIYTGLDDEPWKQGGGGVEAAEDVEKKGVAWLRRARSGSKAASKERY
jgi:hypothetical protein